MISLLVVLAVLGQSAQGLAQTTQPLPPAQSVPLDSTVDVFTIPSPPLLTPQGEAPVRVKPFLTPDPEGLRQWKEFLEQTPGAVPRSPGHIEDVSPQFVTPSPQISVVSSFEGVNNDNNAATTGFFTLPPDDNLGVGPSHIFQMVNIMGRITDKSGGISKPDFSLRSFFNLNKANESDPRVIYDAVSGRWFATYFQFSSFPASSGTSQIVLAVSTTSDPTGTFCRYKLGNPSNFNNETFLQDFPMLGVSDDKVVVSYNGFNFFGSFVGGGYYVLNKANLTACAASVSMTRVAPSFSLVTPHPAQSLGSTSDLFMAMHGSSSTLALLTISGVPGVSPVTQTSTSLGINSWVPPPSAPQAGSSVLLDTGDERVLSVAWQANSLWVAGGEACTPSGDSSSRACLRVIEIKTDTLTKRQDMTYGASGQYYSYPAHRPDSSGNLHMVFTASSSSSFASVRVTAQQTSDPLNSLQASTQIRAGGGAQTSSSSRMGDYSGAAVDPSDTSSVWVMGEYIRFTGSANWGTFIAKLQLGAATDTVTITSGPSGSPNPVASGGVASLSVTASDSMGHALSYSWSASAGSFNDATLQNPTWTAPTNVSGSTQSYTISVLVSDGLGHSASGFYTQQVLTEGGAAGPDLVGSITGLTRSSRFGSSESLRITLLVQNVGTQATASSFSVKFFLSTDCTLDGSDTLLTTRSVFSLLSPGGSTTVMASKSGLSGTQGKFVIAQIDSTNVIVESDEGNNQACRVIP